MDSSCDEFLSLVMAIVYLQHFWTVTNGQKAAEKGYSSDFLPFVSRDRSGESWFSSDSASDNLSDMRELICDPVLDQKKKTQMGSCESTHWTLHTYSTSTSVVHISKPLNSMCLLNWSYFFLS